MVASTTSLPSEGKPLRKKKPNVRAKVKRELRTFDPAKYVRKDWDDRHIEAELERRARGYSGIFRQVLCSAAAVIDRQRFEINAFRLYVEKLEAEPGGVDDRIAADEARVAADLTRNIGAELD